jgi:hypothetical protein
MVRHCAESLRTPKMIAADGVALMQTSMFEGRFTDDDPNAV